MLCYLSVFQILAYETKHHFYVFTCIATDNNVLNVWISTQLYKKHRVCTPLSASEYLIAFKRAIHNITV